MNAREKAPYTHFVSIPMNYPDIQMTFKQFTEAVLADEELSVKIFYQTFYKIFNIFGLNWVVIILFND